MASSTDSDAESLPPTIRDPAKLFYQSAAIRRSVITAYWIVIFLALPLWWHTTSIERLSLPSSRVQKLTQNHLSLPIKICIETPDTIFIERVRNIFSRTTSVDSQRWKGIEVSIQNAKECESSSSNELYRVVPKVGPPSLRGRQLYIPFEGSNASDELVEILAELIAPYTISSDPERRVAQYSPRYRLAFSLLNEDASAGGVINDWNVQDGLKYYIDPILSRLNTLHNFTIESQVQFHSPLAFSPRQMDAYYGLTPEDLTVFINSAEWSLSSSSSNDPVLHFVLFIPSTQRRPLRILTKDNTPSSSSAFLLPQWGSIVIENVDLDALKNGELPSPNLDSVFSTFSTQLLSLLGVPSLPHELEPRNVLSEWQVDALIRRRTIENSQGSRDTLLSIVKLVDQIDNMPVGEDVKGDVENALDAWNKMYESSTSSLYETFRNSANSFMLASRAFFNPGMLALLYFPAEHKYAVYSPLFASAIIPLFVSALREIWAWRKERTKVIKS